MKLFRRKTKGKPTLQEERGNVQDAMKIAIAVNDMTEYHRLNGHLQNIEFEIRKEKENG